MIYFTVPDSPNDFNSSCVDVFLLLEYKLDHSATQHTEFTASSVTNHTRLHPSISRIPQEVHPLGGRREALWLPHGLLELILMFLKLSLSLSPSLTMSLPFPLSPCLSLPPSLTMSLPRYRDIYI